MQPYFINNLNNKTNLLPSINSDTEINLKSLLREIL